MRGPDHHDIPDFHFIIAGDDLCRLNVVVLESLVPHYARFEVQSNAVDEREGGGVDG